MTHLNYLVNGDDEIVDSFAQYSSSLYDNSINSSSTPNHSIINPINPIILLFYNFILFS